MIGIREGEDAGGADVFVACAISGDEHELTGGIGLKVQTHGGVAVAWVTSIMA